MTDKILYTGGPNPFKGLVGYLTFDEWMDKNQYPTNSNERILEYRNIWNDIVESIKSNAPDIVSKIEHVATKRDGTGTIMISIEGHPIECKPGDIFPVPVGYEFKKELKYEVSDDGINWVEIHPSLYNSKIRWDDRKRTTTVLRIVKTEVKDEYIVPDAVRKDDVSMFSSEEDLLIYSHFYDKGVASVSQPEPEESQKELLDAFLNKLYEYTKETKSAGLSPEDSKESVFEVLSTEFTIQRKEMTEYKDEIMFKNFYI